MAVGSFLLVLGAGWTWSTVQFLLGGITGEDPGLPYTTYGVIIASVGAAILAYGIGTKRE
jgi:hypothetical protein